MKPDRGVESEAEEPDLARSRLERYRIEVRHGDIESRAVEVLRTGRATDGPIVLGATVGRANDQRLAQPVVQRLGLISESAPAIQLL